MTLVTILSHLETIFHHRKFTYTIIVIVFIASSVKGFNIISYYKNIHVQRKQCNIITRGYKSTNYIKTFTLVKGTLLRVTDVDVLAVVVQ